ncbi:MAG: HNH endonuclease [Planctomycetales bacterium]|nr:HNH endonuclease [Planctomycetales bacterium]
MDEELRSTVRRRAKHRCEYCQLPQECAPIFRFHIEHIRARQHGGGDEPANLALACPNCNHHKGPNLTGIDPITDTVVMLFDPRTQSWAEHFEISGPRILGRTPNGRATVRLLDINGDQQLRMRATLHDRGEWP